MGAIDTSVPQPDRIRLHITPFNADLYDRIIPPSLQSLASDPSFHSIQTFPERGYGFVELPAMEAHKLRKKLNGSTLKGTKMSVEEARPAKKRKSDADVEPEESEKKRTKREKNERRKKEDGVLAGHELEEGRRVKRGWTGDDLRDRKTKDGKEERKEKGTGGSEERKLRFKTKVPPNKAELKGEREKKKKDKKDKKANDKGQTVVDEFTKRRKSRKNDSPLEGLAPGSTTYEEGQGWVDEAGNVLEPERRSKRRKRQPSISAEPSPAVDTPQATAEVDQSQPNNVANEAAEEAEEAARSQEQASASSDSDSDSEGEAPLKLPSSQQKEIHPLEALFKRPGPAHTTNNTATTTTMTPSSNTTPSKPRPAPIDTSFSFFGAGGDDEDVNMGEDGVAAGEGGMAMPPVTPHTKQDLEWRSLRSAAPTPDTAAIGRKFSFPFANSNPNEEDEDDEDEDVDRDMGGWGGEEEEEEVEHGERGGKMHGEKDGERGEESAFRKWFFENRGDLNRGWKKRRREERKVKRQRENRRLGRKVA